MELRVFPGVLAAAILLAPSPAVAQASYHTLYDADQMRATMDHVATGIERGLAEGSITPGEADRLRGRLDRLRAEMSLAAQEGEIARWKVVRFDTQLGSIVERYHYDRVDAERQ